ncbi:MAG: 2OG-Fe(II) oxygenase [Hyphomicrobiaceae bacterium]
MAKPQDIVRHFLSSVSRAPRHDRPYPHWFLDDCLPEEVARDVTGLPFPAPELGGLSGKRELHNNTRKYFDAENKRAFPVVDAVAQAFQTPEMTRAIERTFGIDLDGAYLRIEFAQDVDGFWLEPHTDLGVKLFTLLLYLSDDPSHKDLGTDIYDAAKQHVARSPFAPNAAMVFIPSDNTFHGFEKRSIQGVRKSLIINYVTDAWRAREQLAVPEAPIRRAAAA